MIVLGLLILLFCVWSYFWLAWKENQTVDADERILHAVFRIAPFIVLGLIGLAATI